MKDELDWNDPAFFTAADDGHTQQMPRSLEELQAMFDRLPVVTNPHVPRGTVFAMNPEDLLSLLTFEPTLKDVCQRDYLDPLAGLKIRATFVLPQVLSPRQIIAITCDAPTWPAQPLSSPHRGAAVAVLVAAVVLIAAAASLLW